MFLFAILASATAFAEDVNVYFGNLHAHTSYSDGSGTPDQAFKYARDTADLDFLAVVEHSHKDAEAGASSDRKDGKLIATTPALYDGAGSSSLLSAAAKYTQDGRFVAIYGQEFSSITKGNHVNVFDVPHVITSTNGDFADLVNNWLPANLDTTGAAGLLQFNHPGLFDDAALEYGADDFGSQQAWIAAMDPKVELIEVLNGPAMTKTSGNAPAERMEEDFRHYLNLGFHVAPTADQDNHYKTWGTATDARTAVLAPSLTKAALLAGLRARHVYATTDKNLRVWYSVDGHLMGDRIAAPVTPGGLSDGGHRVKIELRLDDDDEPTANYVVEVWTDVIGGAAEAEMIDAVAVSGNTPQGTVVTMNDLTYEGGEQYVYLKIKQAAPPDEDAAADLVWTAPVWMEPGAPTASGVEDGLVASKNSLIYHVSASCSAARQIAPQNLVKGSTAKQGRTRHEGCPK